MASSPCSGEVLGEWPRKCQSLGAPRSKILALSPSRRAIGAALVDGLGVAKVFLCRLADLKGEEEFIAKARVWLNDVFTTEKPMVVVIEGLTPKRATRTNLMLAGLLEATAAAHHVEHVFKAEPGKALAALQAKSLGSGAAKAPARPTLRQAALWLADDCPELRIHEPKKPAIISRDWERSWGLVVKAAAIALYARDGHFENCDQVYATPSPSQAAPASAADTGRDAQ